MDAEKMMMNDKVRPGWGVAGFSIAMLLLLVLVLYRETVLYVTSFWNRWDTGEYYAHGYLVLGISLYLIFSQRKKLASMTPCASLLGLFSVAVSSLLWLTAAETGVLIVQTIALQLLVLSILWAVLGNLIARYLVFPILILVFALPVWSPLPPLLQEVTADAAFRIARIIGVVVVRQEQLLILPAGTLSVEESCSGISYLLAAMTLGMLYGYLKYQRFWSRLLVVVISGCAAIVVNILRVVIVVQQAYVTDMQTSLVHDHFNLGWYLFGGLVFVLLLLDNRVSRHAGNVGASRQFAGDKQTDGCIQGYTRRFLVLLATGALLASGPVIAWWSESHSNAIRVADVIMPVGVGGWSGPSDSTDTWMPVFHGAVAGKGTYQKGGYVLHLYVGYYPEQKQGRELIYYGNTISNNDLWRTAHLHERTVNVDGQAVLEQELQSVSGKRRLLWYWYRVAGFNTTSQYMAKGLQLLGMITGKPQAAVIAVALDLDDVTSTRQALHDFTSAMRPSLSLVVEGSNG